MNELDQFEFSTKDGFNSVLIKERYDTLQRFFKGDSCLELGCADGEGTKILLQNFKRVVGVDGSGRLIKQAKANIKDRKVEFVCSYFEHFKTKERFDVIYLGHILEHVDNPIIVLKDTKTFLKKDGIMIIDVPNAMSIHRQAGVLMGTLKNEYELNDADRSIGHKRVYDLGLLKKDITKAGLEVIEEGDIFIKPFPNNTMLKLINNNNLKAYSHLGAKYPEIAAEIYIICKV